MNCRAALRSIAEKSLGQEPAGGSRSTALIAHLRSCPACARAAREEELITSDLARLRIEAPFEVDVVDRVMLRIAEASPDLRAVRPRGAGWLLAGAIASVFAIVWSAIAERSTLWLAARSLTRTAGLLTTMLGDYVRPVAPIIFSLGRAVSETLAPILEHTRRVLPSFQTALFAALVLMTFTTILGIGRDPGRTPRTFGKES